MDQSIYFYMGEISLNSAKNTQPYIFNRLSNFCTHAIFTGRKYSLHESIMGKWYRTPEAAQSGTETPAYEFTEHHTLYINGIDVRTTWDIHKDRIILTTCGDREKPIPFKINKTDFETLVIKRGLTAGTYYKRTESKEQGAIMKKVSAD